MPTLLRNPFRKQDENLRPSQTASEIEQRVNGNTDSKAKEIPQVREATEYKLSEINDSGTYLPPSPTERRSFWSTTSSRSTTSTNKRPSLISDSDQFSISRESFDSYRRSFDISARSPVIQGLQDGGSRPGRSSLDSRSFYNPPRASFESRVGGGLYAPPPRTSNSFTRTSQVPAETREEESERPQQDFEDVDIADKTPATASNNKRGLFSRITGYGDHAPASERPTGAGSDGKSWHHFGGRKRGQSGQGAELGAIPGRQEAPKVESGLKKEVQSSPQQQQQQQKRGSTDSRAAKDITPNPAKTSSAEPEQDHRTVAGGPLAPAESPVDSGVDVEGMRSVDLNSSPPEIKIDSLPTKKKEEAANLQGLQPQTAQAPEVTSDSWVSL
ncbi:hypothetical protein LTR62_002036 [Meristemomyces frigidus]|uniref:Uncharacterized protein n=1 Tax=Meristemomyces frigidus TaxID=1508187 RepID=A0AAN7TJV9_9PEZI|nr:hypothetical protein LTR62_002036 [Meristemomyces frigidus]